MSEFTVIDELILEKGNPIDDKLKERWTFIEQMDNVFRYKLYIEKQKIVPGKYQFFVEVCNSPKAFGTSGTKIKYFQHFSTIPIVQHYVANHK